MSDFDPNWPHGHQTRAGVPARIIALDAEIKDYPIVAMVKDEALGERIVSYTAGGLWVHGGYCHRDKDLINAPAPKRKIQVDCWLNVYEHATYAHKSKDSANGNAKRDRFALIHICKEVEDGEGIDG